MAMSLLVADSNRDLNDLQQRFFSSRGYRVETVSDGLGCLAKLRELRPDVLVLDLDLPWGGGSGVLARMREEPDIPSIPVIVLSLDRAVGDDLASPPVVACLSKPFRLAELEKAIGSAGSRSVNAERSEDDAQEFSVTELEERIRSHLKGRLQRFCLLVQNQGLVLQGEAVSYHAKQMAQHAVMEATRQPILANDIKVSYPTD